MTKPQPKIDLMTNMITMSMLFNPVTYLVNRPKDPDQALEAYMKMCTSMIEVGLKLNPMLVMFVPKG